MKLLRSLSICALCTTMLLSYTAAAADFASPEQQLRLRLKNELRRADKPSAGANRDIYAWVQGAALEFDTGMLNDYLAIEGGGFYVYKLGARSGYHTRWYLDDYDSFGYANLALKVKLGDYGLLKAGRFVTDAAYGALPYAVPLIDGASNRTLPVSSQGVLLYLTPSSFMDVWALWRNEVFLSTDALQGGYRHEGVYDSKSGEYKGHKPRSFLAVSFYDKNNWRWSLGGSYQNDVDAQFMTNFDQHFAFSQTDSADLKLRYLYADAFGQGSELYRQSGIYSDDTNLFTAAFSYNQSWGSIGGSIGYLQHETNGMVVDSDQGFPFALSLDRNHEDMWAYQLNLTYKINDDFSFTLAPLYSRGYESYSKEVRIEGYDLNAGVAYIPKSGALKGLKVILGADRGFENRPGSKYGDKLQFWDIKMTVQYDLNLL